MFVGARRHVNSTMAAMFLHGGGGHANLCPRIDVNHDPNPKAGGCPGNGLHLYYLVGVHATNRVITCSLIYIKNIPCDECIRLDYYDVISTADELGMTIITLGRLYFLLSCWLTPTDATSMPQ
jgi:hypothetical protein